MNQDSGSAKTFSERAAAIFGTRVLGSAVGIVNGILLAALLGPAAKGDYYLLILVPSTMMVLIQLGLPQAFQFFTARGRTGGLLWRAGVLTILLSIVGFIIVVGLLPVLRDAVYHDLDDRLIFFAFLALPLALGATFYTGIVMGRQAVRWYAAVNIAYPIATTIFLVLILGGLGPTVAGAVAVYLIASLIQTVGFAIGARRLTSVSEEGDSVSFGGLLRYGLTLYPGTLTQFFSYRADGYLIAFLIADPSAPLGYYSMAVGLAELVFFFPNAVSTLFFPHVAGSARADSDRQVTTVSRVTLLVTAAAALAVVPGAFVMISVLLPEFGPALPALFVLLPGVVALSVTKILSGYVSGIGRPALTSYVNVVAFILNIVANVLLIPPFGIVGAAAASLLSYTASSVAFSMIAARLTRTPINQFWVPRPSDIRFILSTSLGLLKRLRPTSRSLA